MLSISPPPPLMGSHHLPYLHIAIPKIKTSKLQSTQKVSRRCESEGATQQPKFELINLPPCYSFIARHSHKVGEIGVVYHI